MNLLKEGEQLLRGVHIRNLGHSPLVRAIARWGVTQGLKVAFSKIPAEQKAEDSIDQIAGDALKSMGPEVELLGVGAIDTVVKDAFAHLGANGIQATEDVVTTYVLAHLGIN